MLALNVRDDSPVEKEIREARVATAEAALAALDDATEDGIEALRAELETERRIAASAREGEGRPIFPIEALRAKALAARRERLLAMRRNGAIGEEAFHRLQEELDLGDVAVATRT